MKNLHDVNRGDFAFSDNDIQFIQLTPDSLNM